MSLFSTANAEVDLDLTMLQEDLERHECQSLRLGLELQLTNLLRMRKELPPALRFVVEAVAELVRGNVRPLQPELIAVHDGKGAGEGDLAVPHRLHLGASQDNTALDRLEYGIVMPGLTVLREDRIELLILLRLHLQDLTHPTSNVKRQTPFARTQSA